MSELRKFAEIIDLQKLENEAEYHYKNLKEYLTDENGEIRPEITTAELYPIYDELRQFREVVHVYKYFARKYQVNPSPLICECEDFALSIPISVHANTLNAELKKIINKNQ